MININMKERWKAKEERQRGKEEKKREVCNNKK